MKAVIIVLAGAALTAAAIAAARRKQQAAGHALGPSVVVEEDVITFTGEAGAERRLPLQDLESVEIRTNALGPYATDLYWVLTAAGASLVIPGDARGNEQLLSTLQKLPGFDNESAIRAMGSTDDATFPCWRRSRQP